jgi:hypothetical protein
MSACAGERIFWPGLLLGLIMILTPAGLFGADTCRLEDVIALKNKWQFEQALAQLNPLLAGSCQLSPASRVAAHLLRVQLIMRLGANIHEAQLQPDLVAILDLAPDFDCEAELRRTPDFPPEICPQLEYIANERQKNNLAIDKRRAAAAVSARRFSLWRLLPLGAGQYANQQPLKGTAFLAGETALLGLGLYFHFGQDSFFDEYRAAQACAGDDPQKQQALAEYAGDDLDRAKNFKTMRNISLSLLGVAAVSGIIEGFVSNGTARNESTRATGQSARLGPEMNQTTLFLSFRGQF